MYILTCDSGKTDATKPIGAHRVPCSGVYRVWYDHEVGGAGTVVQCSYWSTQDCIVCTFDITSHCEGIRVSIRLQIRSDHNNID